MKKILSNVLRFVISFGLLTYLVLTADVQKIYATVIGIDFSYFGIALLIFSGTLFLFALRWQILLRQNEINPGYNRLLIYYLIAYFLNNFLPTTIGGDVSRAYNVAKISGKRAASFGIVLLERILGFLATLTLASLSMFWVIGYFHTSLIIILNLTLLFFVVFALVYLLNPASFNFTRKLIRKITILEIGDKVSRILTTIHAFRHSKFSILYVYLLSLCIQILLIVMNFVLAIALGLHQVTPAYLFLVVPVTFVMGMIPSINGIGVRDYGYKELLTRIGLLPAEALSLSFLNTIIPLLTSLAGGVLLIFYREDVTPPVIDEAETQVD